MSETKKCVFCGNKADWDNLGGICNDCYNRMETQDAIARIRADERAKVIDEFVNAIEEHQQKNWIDNLEYGITFADIEEVANQLKSTKQ